MLIRKLFLLCGMLLLSIGLFSETANLFRIEKVTYEREGLTREFPLRKAVPISTTRIFQSEERLAFYLADLQVQFMNQRVFQSARVESTLGEVGVDGITPVHLTVYTVDTWNIIALPYPKYDSNTGFELKFKIKDYNFFGSMQVLSGDLSYQLDNDNASTISSTLDFAIPFEAFGYSFEWTNEASYSASEGEIPQFDFSTGVDITIPYKYSNLVLGVEQSMTINDRGDDGLYTDDRLYFTDAFSASMPFFLYEFDYFGQLTWSPTVSISQKWAFTGITHPDLFGPSLNWGHSLKIGRFDWVGNFRKGLTAELSNSYKYNLSNSDSIAVKLTSSTSFFTSLYDRVGLTTRIKGLYNFNNRKTDDIASDLRGILDDRMASDFSFLLNMDFPIRIMRVNFQEITGVNWTRFIGFEMHASPFFDMALTHDPLTGRYFNLDDGWYSGGMEILIFPARMRSIYGRISAGWDLVELSKNGGDLSGRAERDGASIRELFIGIGLYY